jgi:hypothetical protein
MDIDLFILSLSDRFVAIGQLLNDVFVPDRAVNWICNYVAMRVRLLVICDGIALVLENDRRQFDRWVAWVA